MDRGKGGVRHLDPALALCAIYAVALIMIVGAWWLVFGK